MADIPVYMMNRHKDGFQAYDPELLSSNRKYHLVMELFDGRVSFLESGLSSLEVPHIVGDLIRDISLLVRVFPNVNPKQVLLLSDPLIISS